MNLEYCNLQDLESQIIGKNFTRCFLADELSKTKLWTEDRTFLKQNQLP